VIGAAIAWLTVGEPRKVAVVRPLDLLHPCPDPSAGGQKIA